MAGHVPSTRIAAVTRLDPQHATVHVRRAGTPPETAFVATLGRIGARGVEIETRGAELDAGERVILRVAFPHLLRPIAAETEVIDRRGGRLRCRWVRVGPGGARVLLHARRAARSPEHRSTDGHRPWRTAS